MKNEGLYSSGQRAKDQRRKGCSGMFRKNQSVSLFDGERDTPETRTSWCRESRTFSGLSQEKTETAVRCIHHSQVRTGEPHNQTGPHAHHYACS